MLGMTVDTKNSFKVTIAVTRQMDRKSPEPTLDQDLMTRLGIERPHHVTQTPIASIWRVTRADGSYAALKCYFQDDLQDEAPGFDLLKAQNGIEPPHLNWSSAMFRKRRTDNDEQTIEAGRDYHEVEAS